MKCQNVKPMPYLTISSVLVTKMFSLNFCIYMPHTFFQQLSSVVHMQCSHLPPNQKMRVPPLLLLLVFQLCKFSFEATPIFQIPKHSTATREIANSMCKQQAFGQDSHSRKNAHIVVLGILTINFVWERTKYRR